jgi:murein DD-endopeptidase MepM/ murein hydrolase activator NlpD
MAYPLGDIFIGNFPETQAFGANPQRYSSLYGIKGHNGLDFGCPSFSPILSAAPGVVKEVAFDDGGYGKYIKIIHEGYLTLYGHLNDATVKVGDRVVGGQLIAHSNNSGFSTAPHLHFGVAPCDPTGTKTEINNGYSGYIDPNSSRCEWQIKNLAAPTIPGGSEEEKMIPVTAGDFTRLRTKATNYDVIVAYLLNKQLNKFTTDGGNAPLDLMHPDPLDGEKTVTFLISVFDDLIRLDGRLREALKDSQLPLVPPSTDEVLQTMPQQEKDNALRGLLETVRRFIIK